MPALHGLYIIAHCSEFINCEWYKRAASLFKLLYTIQLNERQ